MEYNIIENPSDQELYDAFVEEVNKKELSMKEIMDKLGKSKTWYYDSWKMIHKRWINYNKS